MSGKHAAQKPPPRPNPPPNYPNRGRGGAALLCLTLTGGAGAFAFTGQMDNSLSRSFEVFVGLGRMALEYRFLAWKISNLPRDVQRLCYDEFHKEWADQPLKVILKLRGFYVKAGQVASCNPALIPEPYANSLKVLQEDVPFKPFSEVKKILEDELRAPMSDVFETFEELPIGSASIGQVHFATLKGTGEEVVVKVQYPEAERYFNLDFWTALKILEVVNPELVDLLKKQQRTFKMEFNYAQEAANLDFMNEAFRHVFRGVEFPKPVSEYCGRRVLVMTRCRGETITKYGNKLLAEAAHLRGLSVKEFKGELRMAMRDPKKLEQLSRVVPSIGETTFDALRALVWLRNAIVFWREPTYIPPNGPRLMKLLFDVHGYQVFNVGSFNSDPHPGNVMLDAASGVVSLIDYGQLVRIEDEEWRENFARFIIALDDGNKDEVSSAYLFIYIMCCNHLSPATILISLILIHISFYVVYLGCQIVDAAWKRIHLD